MDECKKCGECCKWVYWTTPHRIELTPVMRFRGFRHLTECTIGIPCPCRLLDQETGLCMDYENRPQECKDFPNDGEGRPDECGYKEDL